MRLGLTIRHVFDFGPDRELVGDDLIRADRWDALRTQTCGAFAIASSRAELAEVADSRPELDARARAIAKVARTRRAESLASYGVGGAVLELCLMRAGSGRLRLTLSDYAPETVTRLRQLFPEAEVQRFDLTRDPPLRATSSSSTGSTQSLTTTLGEWSSVASRLSRYSSSRPRLRTRAPGGRILELAGGTGNLGLALEARGFRVDYTELSSLQKDFTRVRIKRHKLQSVVRALDWWDDLERASYDVVCAFDVFEPLPDLASTLTDIADAMRRRLGLRPH